MGRGGDWKYDSGSCRAANRGTFAPSNRSYGLGLRLARVPNNRNIKATGTDPDRKAAEYVLSIGGTVRVNGLLEDTKNLPAEPFQLMGVALTQNEKVTDATLAYFKDCKKLTHLDLYLTAVTDAGMAHLKDCRELELISLGKTKETAAGLKNFADCPKLKHLHLFFAPDVDDAALKLFQNRTDMLALNFSGTKVTDAGMAVLKQFPNLTGLYLDSTAITDTSLAPIQNLNKLTMLVVTKTKVSAEGVKKFRAALPECKVTSDFPE